MVTMRPDGVADDENLDLDTRTKGRVAPFEADEGDHTAFVHLVWHAKHRGWTLRNNDSEIAEAILRSRALATQKAFARHDALRGAAKMISALGKTATRAEVVALLENLAEIEVSGERPQAGQ